MTAPERLIGRERERALLAEAVEAAASGHGRVVVLEGDPGIGKSRLLAALATAAEEAGCQVRAGRGDELGRGRPFGPVAQALGLRPGAADEDADRVGRLLAGEGEVDTTGLPMGGDVRFRILDTILGMVDRATSRAPLALVLDDLHWADDDTLRVVVALAEQAPSLPLLLAVATRRHPRAPELTTTLRALAGHGAVEVDVGPLDDAATQDLAADVVDGDLGPGLIDEVRRAGGNPFLIIELIATLSAVGALAPVDGAIELRQSRPRQGPLQDAVLQRLDHLRPSTVELLRAGSVLGRTFSLTVAGALVGRGAVELAADVDEALTAGVLQEAGDKLSFSHDLLREGIYDALPEAVRSAMHVEAARALAASHAEAFDVAAQAERTSGTTDAEAVEWLVRGADQMRVTAPGTAAGFLTRAAELLDPAEPRRLEVEARLAEAHTFSGRLRDGEALAEQCLARDDLPEDDHRRLTYLLGQTLFLQGRLAEAARWFEVAAAEDPAGQAAVLADSAVTLLLSGDLERAAETADRALEVARAADDAAAETCVLAAQSWIAALRGDLPLGLELGRTAVVRADGSGTLEAHRNVPYVFYAQVLMWADHDAEAEDALRRAADLGRRLGLVWDVPLQHLLRSRAAYRGGRWDEAVAEAQAGLSHSRDQDGSIADVWLWCALAKVLVGRGEREEAVRCLDAADAEVESSGQGRDQAAWMRALTAEAGGDLEAASLFIDLLWDGLAEQGLDYYLWDVASDVVRIAVARGDEAQAEQVLATLVDLAERFPDSSAPVVEARCRGIAHRDADALLVALARQDERKANSRPVEAAIIMREAATVLEWAGRSDEAKGLVARAAPVLAGAGAHPPAVPGLEAPEPVEPTEAVMFGWEALTERELEVIRLLAQSRSNAEIAEELFCSRRTVESHLSHAYTKLGISSRVELAIEANQRLGAAVNP